MPVIKSALESEGALVDVLLGWSTHRARQLRAALKPVPPPVDARAILDTGAEITCVDPSLVQSLGLPFGGTTFVNLPAHGGMNVASLYDAGPAIVHPSGNARDNLNIRDLSVFEVSLAPLGYQVIVGRDVLAKCRFFYDGPGDEFELAY